MLLNVLKLHIINSVSLQRHENNQKCTPAGVELKVKSHKTYQVTHETCHVCTTHHASLQHEHENGWEKRLPDTTNTFRMVFYFTLENAGGVWPHPERGCSQGQDKADMVTRKTGKVEEEGQTRGLSDSYGNFTKHWLTDFSHMRGKPLIFLN